MRIHAPIALALVAALASGAAAPAPAGSPGLTVSAADADGGSRVEFRGGDGAILGQDERAVRLRFAHPGQPDLARFVVQPPALVKSVQSRRTPHGLDLTLMLAEGVQAHVDHSADGLKLQLSPRIQRPRSTEPARVSAGEDVAGLALTFAFGSPTGAAVFRRGDALWLVFDADAPLNLAGVSLNPRKVSAVSAHRGPGWTALRLTAPAGLKATATAQGDSWTVRLAADGVAPTPVDIAREADGSTALEAALAGATAVRRVVDPVVGDVLTVVTALGPAKGLPSGRSFVEMTLLPSAQGLGIEPLADDLRVSVDGEHVRFVRPSGLQLSAGAGGAPLAEAAPDAPQRAALPALVDLPGWSRTGPGGFTKRYDALFAAAAAEGVEPDTPHEARLALARFLIGSQLAHEGLGVLNGLGRADPAMMNDAEFRGLRGAAKAMAGRWKDAEADFAAPVLAADPASALWRGLIAQALGNPAVAREQFAAGARAAPLFAPALRLRFERAQAQAALDGGDLDAAARALAAAVAEPSDGAERSRTALLSGRLLEAQGRRPEAIALYKQLVRAPLEAVAAPAQLRLTQLSLDAGTLQPDAAAHVFEALRWRWRGDDTEVEAARALGRLQLAQGRYRESLAAYRAIARGLPDTPAAAALLADQAAAFRRLFLDGGADGMQPIQALGLFYDFRDQTPIGADGDLMVRKLARRLVDVDLLPQAAELLSYQVQNRLDGVAGAQVATDLALIYLMDQQPEKALGAINDSRTTLLPAALNAERRVIEARALAGLGRTDHALELLAGDNSADALDVKAEVAWRGQAWSRAGPALERALGERWRSPAPLSPAEENRLLRAGAAYSLAGDGAALARVKSRYGKLTESARSPEALRVALAGAGEAEIASADFARAVTDADSFATWVSAMKARFRAKPAPTGAAPASLKQAQATAPATAAG